MKRYRELEALDPKAAAASSLLSQVAAARLAEGDTAPLAADLAPLAALPAPEVDDLELAFFGAPPSLPSRSFLVFVRAGGHECVRTWGIDSRTATFLIFFPQLFFWPYCFSLRLLKERPSS